MAANCRIGGLKRYRLQTFSKRQKGKFGWAGTMAHQAPAVEMKFGRGTQAPRPPQSQPNKAPSPHLPVRVRKHAHGV